MNRNEKKVEDYIYREGENNLFIGIDPGVNGGVGIIRTLDGVEEYDAFRCPKTPDEMFKELDSYILDSPDIVTLYIEFVHSFPGQGVVSTFTFGQNYGQWQGIIASLGVKSISVTPQSWIGFYNIKKGLTRKDRKRKLLGLSREIFPNTKITFNISDALLIANYGKIKYYEEKMNGSYD